MTDFGEKIIGAIGGAADYLWANYAGNPKNRRKPQESQTPPPEEPTDATQPTETPEQPVDTDGASDTIISAAEVSDTPAPNFDDLGDTTPKNAQSSVESVSNQTSGVNTFIQDLIAQQEKEGTLDTLLQNLGVDTAGKDPKQALIDWYQAQGPDMDIATFLEQQRDKYGVPGMLSQIKAQNEVVANLKGELNKLEIDRLAAIERQYARQASMTSIEAEVAEIDREYRINKAYKTAELGTQAALLNAYVGNLEAVEKLISTSVDAYTYDVQEEIRKFDKVFDTMSDWVDSLDESEQQMLKNMRDDLIRQENYMRENTFYNLDLMSNPNTSGAFAGLSVQQIREMSNEEAVKRVADWIIKQPSTTGTSYSFFTDNYGMVRAIDKNNPGAGAISIGNYGKATAGMTPLDGNEAINKLGQLDIAIDLLEGGYVDTGWDAQINWTRYRYVPEEVGELRGSLSNDQTNFNTILNKLSTNEMFTIGGKVLPAHEIERLKSFLPSLNQNKDTNLQALKTLKTELENLYAIHFNIKYNAGGASGDTGGTYNENDWDIVQ